MTLNLATHNSTAREQRVASMVETPIQTSNSIHSSFQKNLPGNLLSRLSLQALQDDALNPPSQA
jgi:hypothetical protein